MFFFFLDLHRTEFIQKGDQELKQLGGDEREILELQRKILVLSSDVGEKY